MECRPNSSPLHQRLNCGEVLSKPNESLPKVSKTHRKISSVSPLRPEFEVCSILACEAHMALLNNLQMSSVTDVMVGFILSKNIIGYFLSQGMQDIRLATDVYHRARIIKCFKRGDYTIEEDDIILKFVKAEGRKFAKLGKMLKRSRGSVTARYDLLVQRDNIKDGSPYTV